jgi:hypothetical protein
VSQKSRILAVAATLVALACRGAWAADDGSPAPAATNHPAATSSDTPEELQEVTVTAQHLKLTWAQHNELVQKAATFAYGIQTVGSEDQIARWRVPICPYLKGLLQEDGQYIIERIWITARTAGGVWLAGNAPCQPNLRIYVTPQPKEFLRSSHLLGGAKQSRIDQFIERAGPVWVWRSGINAGMGNFTFGPVVVVIDQARLSGVSQKQLADYIAMVSLVEVKPTAQLGDAQTILRLFEGGHQSAPDSLSDWDRAYLKAVYHLPERNMPTRARASDRSNVARRMINYLVR